MSRVARPLPIVTALIALAPVQLAYGQTAKTFVASGGDDADPCSRTYPCKTFAGAISKTLAGGEIVALDSAEYGAVTITKSITLDGSAVMAGLQVAGNGITVNAGLGDVVILRGLTIDGNGTGGNGIRIIQALKVFITDCNVFGFTTRNISVEPSTYPVLVYVSNTHIHDSVSNGIVVKPALAGLPALVTLNKVEIVNNNNFGLSVTAGSTVIVRDSIISGNAGGPGLSNVRVDGTGGSAAIGLENVMISNGFTGIQTIAGGSVVVNNSSITYNDVGLSTAGGTVYSYGNNRLVGNGTDGSFTSTLFLR
jgi:hypothetical protein